MTKNKENKEQDFIKMTFDEALNRIGVEKIMKLLLWNEDARINLEEHAKKFSTYILQDNGNKLYKIGRTTNFEKRISVIKTSNPLLKIIGISERDIESELHEKYKNNRMIREWFSFTEKEINYIFKEYGFISYKNNQYARKHKPF